MKKYLHISKGHANIARICKKLRLGCLVLVCDKSESGMVKAACVQCRAFSQELPPEIFSRDGRLTPLPVLDVSASEKLRLS